MQTNASVVTQQYMFYT